MAKKDKKNKKQNYTGSRPRQPEALIDSRQKQSDDSSTKQTKSDNTDK